VTKNRNDLYVVSAEGIKCFPFSKLLDEEK